MTRFPSREVFIGNRPLGGRNPIRLQSMTNTPALDINATVNQAIRILEAGADYVRISAPNRQSALNLQQIKKGLHQAGFYQPLIADIHFNPDLALVAARLVEKVRINPGNYNGPARRGQKEWTHFEYEAELAEIKNNISPLLKVCSQYGTALRIGTNFGSLSPRIIARYGNTPEGMVQSTIEFLKIFEDQGFFNTVISLKASNPLIMIRSYLLMVERMMAEGMNYPLHLGVTEAGEGENGRIKSALGISTLLQAGIGDTIRVSLSEPPEDEIPVARKIASPFQQSFTIAPDPSTSFQVLPLDWRNETNPDLPGGNKAVVINPGLLAFRQEIHFHPGPLLDIPATKIKYRPDLTIVSKSPLEAEPDGPALNPAVILKTDAGEEYQVLNEDQFMDDLFLPHPVFNILHLTRMPSPVLVKKMKTIPGPVILWEPENSRAGEQTRALLREMKTAGVSAALIPRMKYHLAEPEDFLLQLTADWGRLLLERKILGLWIQNPSFPDEAILEACFGLLQATGLRITQTEYISCPTCARTSFDLPGVLREVKAKTRHLPGLKIAVMGCVVNGPGEMADADYGIMGAGPDKVHLFKGNQAILKNIPQEQAANALLKLINDMIINELK